VRDRSGGKIAAPRDVREPAEPDAMLCLASSVREMAAALIDRLVHHATMITLKGKS
jgi:hypothetical protein